MTSYFWSGFPSLSGRSDVMYGRRHIGGTEPPALYVTPISSDSYAIVSPIAYRSTSPRFSSFRFGLVESTRLTSQSYAVARKRVVRSANLRPVVTRREGIVVSSCARTKSRLVFYLMAIRNYASTPGTAYACTANWPGQADRRGYISIIRGNYYERPSSSILIFCSRPLRPPPRQRLNPALCFAMEMILWGYMRGRHHQSASSERWENSLQLWLQGRLGFALASLTDWIRPSIRSFVRTFAELRASACGKASRFK